MTASTLAIAPAQQTPTNVSLLRMLDICWTQYWLHERSYRFAANVLLLTVYPNRFVLATDVPPNELRPFLSYFNDPQVQDIVSAREGSWVSDDHFGTIKHWQTFHIEPRPRAARQPSAARMGSDWLGLDIDGGRG